MPDRADDRIAPALMQAAAPEMAVAGRALAVRLSPTEEADLERCADLALAFRLAAHLGFDQPACANFSVRLNGADPSDLRFALNPLDAVWPQLRAEELRAIDPAAPLADDCVDPAAVALHGAILAARPDVGCVLHAHPPHATALTLLQDPRLRTASQTALRFRGRIAYLTDYDGPLMRREDAERAASALTDKSVLLMANHGVVVVGATVAEAFDDLYHLEKAAELQILATSTGIKLRRITKPVADRAMGAAAPDPAAARRHFAAWKRRLAAANGHSRD